MTVSRTFGGAVLVGGSSRRMGVDKATLDYKGQTLRLHMRGLLEDAGANPVHELGGNQGLPDPSDASGPAAGLFALTDAAAATSGPQIWVIVPVDMPLLTPIMLKQLANNTAPAAHFADHPLPMMIRLDRAATALAALRPQATAEKGLALWRILEALGAEVVTPESTDAENLANFNSPGEWRRLLSR